MGKLRIYPVEIFPVARFGMLEVKGIPFHTNMYDDKIKCGWFCVADCDCGSKNIIANVSSLKSGSKSSCGCFRSKCVSERFGKHRDTNSRLYVIWAGMVQRCENPNHHSYANYGGRGISLHGEWREYANFMKWSTENGYGKSLQIDRKDNDGNYCPENCRWTTSKVNGRNTRHCHFVEAFGERKTVVEWTEDQRCAVGYRTLLDRLYRWNDSEKSITYPSRK